MRGQDQWGRPKRLELWRRLRAAVAESSSAERAGFKLAIRPHLSTLRRFASFELKHLRAQGQLMSDYPSVDDLIDEVLARAAADSDLLKHPENAAAKLCSIVIDVTKEAVAGERRRRRMLSLEAPPPREATDIAIDETFYDFFQPDNLTKVEDLAADPSADPEEAVSRKEMQRLIASLFASMPAAWRRAVALTRVGGLPVAAVAPVLKSTEAEVRDWLARADNFLRARLRDEDIVSSDSSQLSYLAEALSIEGSETEASFDAALENESPQ